MVFSIPKIIRVTKLFFFLSDVIRVLFSLWLADPRDLTPLTKMVSFKHEKLGIIFLEAVTVLTFNYLHM